MPKKQHCYDYPRPALTVDAVIVTREPKPRVLLISRKHEPFAGRWAIPGGFVNVEEPLATAASRELHEETGIRVTKLEQLHVFDDPRRDPRERVISVAFLGRVRPNRAKLQAADDAAEARWFPLDRLPPLAFDHREILRVSRRRLSLQPAANRDRSRS